MNDLFWTFEPLRCLLGRHRWTVWEDQRLRCCRVCGSREYRHPKETRWRRDERLLIRNDSEDPAMASDPSPGALPPSPDRPSPLVPAETPLPDN